MSKVVVIPKPGKFDEFIGCKVTAQQKARFYELGGVTTLRRMLDSGMQPADAPLTAKTNLELDAAELLFALIDAWPYVHDRCTIKSKRDRITRLMKKHGDFADVNYEQPTEPLQLVEPGATLIADKPNFDNAERLKCDSAVRLHAEMAANDDFTREENGFAQEIALQYGFEHIDDDAQILAVRTNDLHVFMRALGYSHNLVSDIRGDGK